MVLAMVYLPLSIGWIWVIIQQRIGDSCLIFFASWLHIGTWFAYLPNRFFPLQYLEIMSNPNFLNPNLKHPIKEETWTRGTITSEVELSIWFGRFLGARPTNPSWVWIQLISQDTSRRLSLWLDMHNETCGFEAKGSCWPKPTMITLSKMINRRSLS